MADLKWFIMFSFLLRFVCHCQEQSLLNLEERGITSCPSDNFEAVTADIVRIQAGEADKQICLDPNHMPQTFPFYHTVSCESQNSQLSRELLMSSEDIGLFQDLRDKFCLDERNSSDGNEQLLLGMNLAGVSPDKRNFSLKLVCRAVGSSGSGGSDVETSAVIEPRDTTSLRFIPQGQNGSVTTEKGKPVKIAVLVALPDELENVSTFWSDSRIECGPDASVEVPKCVYTSQAGIQVAWSCSITTNKSDAYTFQHRGKLYIVHLTVQDANSTDPSPSSPPPPPPQDLTAIAVVLPVIIIILVLTGIIIVVVCCYLFYRRVHPIVKDTRDIVLDTNEQITRRDVENGRLDTQPEPSRDSTPLESPNEPSSDAPPLPGQEDRNLPEKCGVNPVTIPDDHRRSITDSYIDGSVPEFNAESFMDKYKERFLRCVHTPSIATRLKIDHVIPEVLYHEIDQGKIAASEASEKLFLHLRSHAVPYTIHHLCDVMAGQEDYPLMKDLGEDMKKDKDLLPSNAAIRNNGHTHMTDDRGSTELLQSEDKRRPSGTDPPPVQNGLIVT